MSLESLRNIRTLEVVALTAVAVMVLSLHVLAVNNYGIFRDELYYLACGRRLAWGYVDHPPLVAVMARATSVFGDSLLAIRALPILLAGVLVFITGAIARRLGGGVFAQVLAAALVSLGPHFLFVFHILSMNSAEVALWALAAWLLLAALQSRARWAWLAFGLTAGVGLLTKHSMGVFGLGVFVGLAATQARDVLRSPWPWIAGAIAAVMLAPHVAWQMSHGWPTAEFVRNAQEFKIAEQSIGSFLLEVVLLVGPFTLPLWLAGWWWLIRGHLGVEGRVLGWCAAVVTLMFLLQQSKPYYVTPVWPVLIAAGAVALEEATLTRRTLRYAATVVLTAGALIGAPLALPILPIDTYVTYSRALGLTPTSQERQQLGVLPQHFADMHGWEALARTVSDVYQALPDEERASARVFAQNYGEAGAIEYFAGRYPLPRVISPHNSYWYWGPGPDGGTLIVIGGDRADMERAFERVEQAGETACRYCMPYENGNPIWIGRGWKIPLRQVWDDERRFI
jgi:hypothetical protein